jgi:hypothetical protein
MAKLQNMLLKEKPLKQSLYNHVLVARETTARLDDGQIGVNFYNPTHPPVGLLAKYTLGAA